MSLNTTEDTPDKFAPPRMRAALEAVKTEVGKEVAKINGPEPPARQPEPLPRAQTPLQSIAAQINRLTYLEMMCFARNVHADSTSVGKVPSDVAELLHAWAAREVAGHNNNEDPAEKRSASANA